MVKFSFVLLILLIFFSDAMCRISKVTFPKVIRNSAEVQLYLEELEGEKSKSLCPETVAGRIKSLFGTNYICGLKKDIKEQLCSFILRNKPYELEITIDESQELECTKIRLWLQNSILVKAFKCPFYVMNNQFPINDVTGEVVVNKMSKVLPKTINFWISQGNTENEAFVYWQDGGDNTFVRVYADATVYDVSTIEKLEELKKIGVLSKDNKKYVNFWNKDRFPPVFWYTYVQPFNSSDCEAVNAAQIANKTTNLDVRQLSENQLQFLCYQVTKYKNIRHKLDVTKWSTEKNVKYFLLKGVSAYKCPNLIVPEGTNDKTTDYNYSYILANIGKPAALVAFFQEPTKGYSALYSDRDQYNGPFYIEIDLEILEKVKNKPVQFLPELEEIINEHEKK